MRRVASPPTAPDDAIIYLVLDDYGKIGRAFVETDPEKADEKTVIRNMLEGQYNNPKRVVSFNTAEGWSRDVSEDIAREVANAVQNESDLADGTREFVEAQLGERWNSQRYERENFVEPNHELRAALEMIRQAVAEYVPLGERSVQAREEAEILANSIKLLAQERERYAQINPA